MWLSVYQTSKAVVTASTFYDTFSFGLCRFYCIYFLISVKRFMYVFTVYIYEVITITIIIIIIILYAVYSIAYIHIRL
jgi:hypothetical protein